MPKTPSFKTIPTNTHKAHRKSFSSISSVVSPTEKNITFKQAHKSFRSVSPVVSPTGSSMTVKLAYKSFRSISPIVSPAGENISYNQGCKSYSSTSPIISPTEGNTTCNHDMTHEYSNPVFLTQYEEANLPCNHDMTHESSNLCPLYASKAITYTQDMSHGSSSFITPVAGYTGSNTIVKRTHKSCSSVSHRVSPAGSATVKLDRKSRSSASQVVSPTEENITFNQDITPILQEKLQKEIGVAAAAQYLTNIRELPSVQARNQAISQALEQFGTECCAPLSLAFYKWFMQEEVAPYPVLLMRDAKICTFDADLPRLYLNRATMGLTDAFDADIGDGGASQSVIDHYIAQQVPLDPHTGKPIPYTFIDSGCWGSIIKSLYERKLQQPPVAVPDHTQNNTHSSITHFLQTSALATTPEFGVRFFYSHNPQIMGFLNRYGVTPLEEIIRQRLQEANHIPETAPANRALYKYLLQESTQQLQTGIADILQTLQLIEDAVDANMRRNYVAKFKAMQVQLGRVIQEAHGLYNMGFNFCNTKLDTNPATACANKMLDLETMNVCLDGAHELETMSVCLGGAIKLQAMLSSLFPKMEENVPDSFSINETCMNMITRTTNADDHSADKVSLILPDPKQAGEIIAEYNSLGRTFKIEKIVDKILEGFNDSMESCCLNFEKRVETLSERDGTIVPQIIPEDEPIGSLGKQVLQNSFAQIATELKLTPAETQQMLSTGLASAVLADKLRTVDMTALLTRGLEHMLDRFLQARLGRFTGVLPEHSPTRVDGMEMLIDYAKHSLSIKGNLHNLMEAYQAPKPSTTARIHSDGRKANISISQSHHPLITPALHYMPRVGWASSNTIETDATLCESEPELPRQIINNIPASLNTSAATLHHHASKCTISPIQTPTSNHFPSP